MVEGILLSFNRIPQGQGPYPTEEPIQSSFRDGQLVQLSSQAQQQQASQQRRPRKHSYSSSYSYRDRTNKLDQVSEQQSGQAEQRPRKHSYSSSFSHPEQTFKPQAFHKPILGPDPPSPATVPSPAFPSTERNSLEYDRQRFAPKPRASGSNSFVDQNPPKLTSGRSRAFTGIFRGMTDRRSSSAAGGPPEQRSTSPSYDLNPQDRARRRRSRSLHLTGSVLDRARPVPSEYHDFERQTTTRQEQRKSLHNHDSSGDGRSIQDRGQKSKTNHGPESNHYYNPNTTMTDGRTKRLSGGFGDPTNTQGRWTSQPYSGAGKDRPNFFRRVFSSGKNPNAADTKAPQLPPMSMKRDPEPETRAQTATTPAPTAVHQSQVPNVPPMSTSEHENSPRNDRPSLNKKTSSFFRRRKKTVGEKEAPPFGVETRARNGADPKLAVKSPSVSSLRKVMDPFLADAQSPQDKYFDSLEHQPEGVAPAGDVRNSKRGSFPQAAVEGVVPVLPSPRNLSKSSAGNSQRTDASTGTRKGSETEPFSDSRQGDGIVGKSGDVAESSRDFVSPQPDAHRQPQDSSRSFWPKRTHSLGKKSKPAINAPAAAAAERKTMTPRDEFNRDNPAGNDSADVAVMNKPTRIWLNQSDSDVNRESAMSTPGPLSDSTSIARSQVPSSEDIPMLKPVSTPTRNMPFVQDFSDETPRASEANNVDSEFLVPSTDDHDRAEAIFNGGDDPLTHTKGAIALGGVDPGAEPLRVAYMMLFDFTGLNILLALRDLCGRLVLKGETQQVDRVLNTFSRRWCDCNPNHGFKKFGKSPWRDM